VQQLIQHPFTVQIIDEFIIDNKQCMVMELVNRGSLDKVIKTRKEKAEPY
jgi:serine/threonine protein kinase